MQEHRECDPEKIEPARDGPRLCVQSHRLTFLLVVFSLVLPTCGLVVLTPPKIDAWHYHDRYWYAHASTLLAFLSSLIRQPKDDLTEDAVRYDSGVWGATKH